jgi:hypothetical protein
MPTALQVRGRPQQIDAGIDATRSDLAEALRMAGRERPPTSHARSLFAKRKNVSAWTRFKENGPGTAHFLWRPRSWRYGSAHF